MFNRYCVITINAFIIIAIWIIATTGTVTSVVDIAAKESAFTHGIVVVASRSSTIVSTIADVLAMVAVALENVTTIETNIAVRYIVDVGAVVVGAVRASGVLVYWFNPVGAIGAIDAIGADCFARI